MLQNHLAKYKSNFEIVFLIIVHLYKRQNIMKNSQLTAMSLDLLHCVLTNAHNSVKIYPPSPKI